MMANKRVKKGLLNDFDMIDYNRPIGQADDMRTSTYLAHHYLNDMNLRNTVQGKIKSSKSYAPDHILETSRKSDYRTNYLWPRLDTVSLRNPKLGFKHQFIKPLDERKLKFLKRPMRPATSVAHEDFSWRPVKPMAQPSPISLPRPVDVARIYINRSGPGYSKYLDPSATTTRLDYCGLTPAELGRSIARHDNITFWNWPKLKPPTCRVTVGSDGRLCDNASAKECQKRCKSEFPSLVKHVPHSGLTTEVRDNYVEPFGRPDYRIFDTTNIRNIQINSTAVPSGKETDYKFLTSGERVQAQV